MSAQSTSTDSSTTTINFGDYSYEVLDYNQEFGPVSSKDSNSNVVHSLDKIQTCELEDICQVSGSESFDALSQKVDYFVEKYGRENGSQVTCKKYCIEGKDSVCFYTLSKGIQDSSEGAPIYGIPTVEFSISLYKDINDQYAVKVGPFMRHSDDCGLLAARQPFLKAISEYLLLN